MAWPKKNINEDLPKILQFAPALPSEIIETIFRDVEENCTIQDWHRLSLVNHCWYLSATPRLYHSFANHGNLEDRERLWQFMRAIVEQPALAALVKVIDLQHCLKYTGPRSVPLAKRLCKEYLLTLRQGIQESGIDRWQNENGILEALQADDRRPIVSIILACLPNLETLSMHVTYDDLYLRAIAYNAPITKFPNDLRRGTLAFKRIERLFLTTEEPESNLPLEIDRHQPFIYFPALRELTLLYSYFHAELFPWTFGGPRDIRSDISQKLTKVTIDLCPSTPLERFLTFLDKLGDNAKSLTSLSVDFSSVPGSEWDLHGQTALWNRLINFKTTLETLDLFGLDVVEKPPGQIEFCPPVKEFIKLKCLSISPAVLLGNCKKHESPFQLMEHVPPGLDFLGLYAGLGFAGSEMAVADLDTQLEILALGCEPKVIHFQVIGKYCTPLPTSKLEVACRQKGILARGDRMSRGGSGSDFGRSSYRHARPHNPDMYEALNHIQDNFNLL